MPQTFQVTGKELTTGAVTSQPAKYDEIKGKMREIRVFTVFPTANVPYAFPHALGRIPTTFTQGPSGRNGGAPGTVYSDDLPLQANKYSIVLKCSAANTWADVILR